MLLVRDGLLMEGAVVDVPHPPPAATAGVPAGEERSTGESLGSTPIVEGGGWRVTRGGGARVRKRQVTKEATDRRAAGNERWLGKSIWGIRVQGQ